MDELNEIQKKDLQSMERMMRHSEKVIKKMWADTLEQCDNLHQATIVCARSIAATFLQDALTRIGAEGNVKGLAIAASEELVGTPFILALLSVATGGGVTDDAKSRRNLDTVADAVTIMEDELKEVNDV